MSEQIKVIAVTASALCTEDFLDRIEKLCKWNIERIILREKQLSEKEYSALFSRVSEICRKFGTSLSGNTYSDQCKALNAEGFQYSYKAFCEKKGRRFQTEGVSVHNAEEAENACHLGANYLIFGHIFATDCKKGVKPRGLEQLSEICSKVDIPVYAIGGITPENVESCIEAGAAGVCVMSGLMTCESFGFL